MILAFASYGSGVFQMIERALIYSAIWKAVGHLPLLVVLGIAAVVVVGGWLFRVG